MTNILQLLIKMILNSKWGGGVGPNRGNIP